MYKACIFDLDGTLTDSVESIAYSANRAIQEYGFNPNPVEAYKMFAGDGADKMLKRSLIAAGDTNLFYFEQVKQRFQDLFAKDCMYMVKPYDGIVELLIELKNKNIKLAVLSNKPHNRAVDVVETIFGKNYFDIIIGQSDHINKKPSPDGALIIADELSLLTNECLYIGDTDTDMLTGKAANMFTVGVTWGFRDRQELIENHADYIIDSPLELLEIEEIQ
ncbi:phosphoglycolate phosphatase [Lachnotalea glycerini]|jgi:phosphoglycolate phosphatase|uniref:HAD family hydrolase n=1 Tax=Lachnotalea glycerini TaxID=1763509 RepID=A0A255I8Q5_9FIRM|nr:HAD family hydrolase [Lachnotalea glycerini]OYP12817.1 HAD family hydrolase [Lachnotalea glycerini]PXV95747.1 phosphoglycolate phosphatase [Lachnotalea glycerini]RDY33187.1 HAD family hydrolase [Lachnotalea glycerini]